MITTKFLLLALSCAAGLSVGLFFSNSLKKKKTFFSELLNFIDCIIGDITFKQEGIRSIAADCVNTSKSRLKSVLEQYIAAPAEIPTLTFLNETERGAVASFFSGLGKSDIITEKSELENTRIKINEICLTYKTKCETKCSMFIKLGLLGGLAVGILLM